MLGLWGAIIGQQGRFDEGIEAIERQRGGHRTTLRITLIWPNCIAAKGTARSDLSAQESVAGGAELC